MAKNFCVNRIVFVIYILVISGCIVRGDSERNNDSSNEGKRFPVPLIENVYEAWKPVNYGHPFRDPTLYYAPPSLERVQFQSPSYFDKEISRSSRAHIEDEIVGTSRSGDGIFQSKPVVIAAEPQNTKNANEYSVYGSPDINYSAFYHKPPRSGQDGKKHSLPENRETPYEAFQREYFGSAVESRSADPLSFYDDSYDEYRRKDRRISHGGGFQYIDPPNKEKNYYYYSDDSPYYQAKLSIHPKSLLPEKRSYTVPTESKNRREYDTSSSSSPNSASAVVYTFEKGNGQKQKVGVIYNEDDLGGPQINKVFSSNKDTIRRFPYQSSAYRAIPITDNQTPPTLAPRVEELSHQKLVSGELNHVYHGLKYHKKATAPPLKFPLGNPYEVPVLKTRPSYFPAQKSPPIYKTRPHRLEGIFGPAIPTLPPTNVRHLPSKSARRNDVEPRIVYKTVRDMEYSHPEVILHVKESGELYNPHVDTLNAPTGDREARIQLTTERPWLVDFSDAMGTTEKFALLPASTPAPPPTTTAKTNNRPLKFPETFKPKRHIESTSRKPEYTIVIGANYDDNPYYEREPEDYEDIEEKKPEELYEICLIEVPKYLHSALCSSILENKKRSRHIADVETPVEDLLDPTASHLKGGSEIDVTPKDAIVKLDKSLPANLLYSGLNVHVPNEKASKKLKSGPLVISNLSKVKVYKPSKTASISKKTTISPLPTEIITSTSTTMTSTSTTTESTSTTTTSSTTSMVFSTTTTDIKQRPIKLQREDDKKGGGGGLLARLSQYFFTDRIPPSTDANNRRKRVKGKRRKIIRSRVNETTTPSELSS